MGALDNVSPLFVENRKALFAALRLSDADTGGRDCQAIMSRAILWARTFCYQRLGELPVAAILVTAEVAAPTTTQEINRSLASQVEIWLVKWRLMQDLPFLWRDQSGESLLQHNVEAMVREPGPDPTNKMLDRLWAQIEDAFGLLDEDSETEPGLLAFSIGPKDGDLVVAPGATVFRHPQNSWLFAKKYNDGL